MALPPLLAGGVNETVACKFPGIAATPVGAPGTVRGVTLTGGDDSRLLANALLALTVQLTVTPLVRPSTTMGEAAPVAKVAPQVAR